MEMIYSPQNLAQARRQAGLSLTKMAKATGIAYQTLWLYEKTETNPTLKTLQILAHVLGVIWKIQ